MTLKPLGLLRRIRKLPDTPTLYAAYLKRTARKKQSRPVWYGDSQKRHWLGWLAGYSGAGAYGRKNHKRDARFVYNHIRCAPMLAWLVEASGVDTATVKQVYRVLDAPMGYAAQCAAIRKIVPWDVVADALLIINGR